MKFKPDAVLQQLGIASLNEMQVQAIEAFKHHPAVLLLAPTGSGKTLAYLFPLMQLLVEHVQAKALVIVPSRELAIQVESVASKMSTGMLVTSCYGGRKAAIEENNLKANPRLIIGTPGRLADHIRRGNIKPAEFKYLIIDEYDKALELGFMGEMSGILEQLESIQISCFVSATDAVAVPDFEIFKQVHVEDHLHAGIPELKYFRYNAAEKDKLPDLLELLLKTGGKKTIVFSNHRASVERIQEFLTRHKVQAAAYHGAMDQAKRELSVFQFRSGCTTVLNTTDLAARGLDISEVQYIIHYHLPLTKEIYIHRNGRSARMNADGSVILLFAPEEKTPDYIEQEPEVLDLKSVSGMKQVSKVVIFISAGKKDKLNKVDIVGFFIKEGKLKTEAIGMIEVKDHHSFVAVNSNVVDNLLKNIKGKKIKKLNPRIDLFR